MRTVDSLEEEIFTEALALESPVKQKDYIYQACGGNVNLRQRVIQLLNLQRQASFILDKDLTIDADGITAWDNAELSDLTGVTLDRYHLVRLIGSGGMGDVYLAEQIRPLRRRVAVKVIKLGLDTKNFVTRFTAEQQALAVLEHPGITKVFDAGSTRTGRPYFVMELVSGDPATAFCDKHRLTIEQRLAIFLDLCKAIAHAHQKGVIHRDLKPSNILVHKSGNDYHCKVIDFGISKVIHGRVPGETDLTRMACMIGTPEYMSPEQTDTQGNDQDVRTDVYSLGVILYELLTGTTPFELENLNEKNLSTIREIIQTRSVEMVSKRMARMESFKPEVSRDRGGGEFRAFSKQFRGNLDAIVAKCLIKDRDQRYSSVAKLAEDLRKHLSGEPVDLVQKNLLTSLLCIAQRHKKWFWGIVVGTLLLALAFIFSIYSAIGAVRYARIAKEATILSEERIRDFKSAQRVSALQKARLENQQAKFRNREYELRTERSVNRGIARFNAQIRKSDHESPDISKWLISQLPKKAAKLLPSDTTFKSGRDDLKLIHLILSEQRMEFVPADLQVAKTMKILGEKHINANNYADAITCLRESLFIRTQINPSDPSRVHTMILLGFALEQDGNTLESQRHFENARRNLETHPDGDRLRELLKSAELRRKL